MTSEALIAAPEFSLASVAGGSVTLSHANGIRGTRFVVRLPTGVIEDRQLTSDHAGNGREEPAYTSTTTGSTIGRRRRRS